MGSYEVLIKLTDKNGIHETGDVIEIEANDSEKQAELDKLIRYGILQKTADKAKSTQRKPSSTVSK